MIMTKQEDWYLKEGKWYCYKEDELIKGEWVQDAEGRWYYLDSKDGHMPVGWFQTRFNNHWFYGYPESNPSQGIYKGMIVIDKTIDIDGKTYSFDKEGHWIKDVSSTSLSEDGAKFIESWEGFSNKWEDVGDGYLTIGIGTATSGALGNQLYNQGIKSCTHEQAYKWLIQECDTCCKTILAKVPNLRQNELDALISLAYNIGSQSLLNSTLFRLILQNKNKTATGDGFILYTDESAIRNAFLMWNRCNKVVWEGLTRRRISEANLFLNSDYTGNK